MKDNTYNSKIIINSNYAAKHYYDESREYKKVLIMSLLATSSI